MRPRRTTNSSATRQPANQPHRSPQRPIQTMSVSPSPEPISPWSTNQRVSPPMSPCERRMLVPTLATFTNITHRSAIPIPLRCHAARMRLMPTEAHTSPSAANVSVSATTLNSAACFKRATRRASPSTSRAGTSWSSPCCVPSGASPPFLEQLRRHEAARHAHRAHEVLRERETERVAGELVLAGGHAGAPRSAPERAGWRAGARRP